MNLNSEGLSFQKLIHGMIEGCGFHEMDNYMYMNLKMNLENARLMKRNDLKIITTIELEKPSIYSKNKFCSEGLRAWKAIDVSKGYSTATSRHEPVKLFHADYNLPQRLL